MIKLSSSIGSTVFVVSCVAVALALQQVLGGAKFSSFFETYDDKDDGMMHHTANNSGDRGGSPEMESGHQGKSQTRRRLFHSARDLVLEGEGRKTPNGGGRSISRLTANIDSNNKLFRQDTLGLPESVCSLRGDFEYTLWAHSARCFDSMKTRWPSRIVLALHMTMDRFPQLIQRCEDWRGLISVAIFVGSHAKRTQEILEIIEENHCLASYADIHFVRRSSQMIDDNNITVQQQIAGKRLPSGMTTYPFNSVRNCAVMGSRGFRVFLLDVDLEVRPQSLASHDGLLLHLEYMQTLAHDGINGTLAGKPKEKYFWIIGGFETISRLEPMPDTIEDFAQQKQTGRLTHFYPDCERCYATLDLDLFTNRSLEVEALHFGATSPFLRLCSSRSSSSSRWNSRLRDVQHCVDQLFSIGKQQQAEEVLRSFTEMDDPSFPLPYLPGIEPFFIIEKDHFLPQSEDFLGRNCDKVQVYPEYVHYGYSPQVLVGTAILNAGRGDAPTHLHLGRKKSAAYEFKENQNFVAFQNLIANLERRSQWVEWEKTHPFIVRSRDDYFSHIHHKDDLVIPPRPWSRFVAVTMSKSWQEQLVTYKHNETIVCILKTPLEADMDPKIWMNVLQETMEKACKVIDCSPLDEKDGIRYYPTGLRFRADWILHRYWKHHFAQSSDNHASYCVNGGIGDLVVSHESYFSCVPLDSVPPRRMEAELAALCSETELGDCRALFEDRLGGYANAQGDVLGVGESKAALWSERSLRFRLALAMTLYFSLQEPHNPITPVPGGHRHDTSSFCKFEGLAAPIPLEGLWWFNG